jgi:hypothetical protein
MLRRAVLLVLLAGPAAFGQTRPGPTLDTLLTALRNAPNEDAAAALEAQIRMQWVETASPALRLLLVRGLREIGDGQPNDAVDSFDAALDLDPG